MRVNSLHRCFQGQGCFGPIQAGEVTKTGKWIKEKKEKRKKCRKEELERETIGLTENQFVPA